MDSQIFSFYVKIMLRNIFVICRDLIELNISHVSFVSKIFKMLIYKTKNYLETNKDIFNIDLIIMIRKKGCIYLDFKN